MMEDAQQLFLTLSSFLVTRKFSMNFLRLEYKSRRFFGSDENSYC